MQDFDRTYIDSPPSPSLFLSVVIPCFNEPDITRTLDSLFNNQPGDGAVEILIILNQGELASLAIKNQNQASALEVENWINYHQRPDHKYLLIKAFDISSKKAGVGYARKLGMDIAQSRLNQSGIDGVICNLDADCLVSPNYCKQILNTFKEDSSLNGASILFEHREDIPANAESIIQYELHLRLYIQALRQSGFPFAFHTVGSSMACRCSAYFKQGGMNQRKAGEDFYFIQKILRLGNYRDIVDTVVFPSSRTSDRVPFGTGKAMHDLQSGAELRTYSLENMKSVAFIFKELNTIYEMGFQSWIQSKETPYQEIYDQVNLQDIVDDALGHSKGYNSFRKRFCSNFDGFKVMKLLHFGRDHHWPDQPIRKVIKKFTGKQENASNMLKRMRRLEKNLPYYLDDDLNAMPVE